MSESTYSIALAKTSRAKCKTCKEPIQKGELKVFVEAPLREGANFAMSASYHVSCFKIPRKLASAGVDVEQFVGDYLMDNDGELLLDRREEVLDMLREAASKTKAKTKKAKSSENGSSSTDLMERLKEAASVDDDGGKAPPKKKAKTNSKSKEEQEFKAMISIYRKYQKGYTVAKLKDILRWNQQLLTGTKSFVLFKVIDGELHGRLSICPLCQGDLKLMEGDYDKIYCSGRYDEDIGRRIPCSYTVPRLGNAETIRARPFYLEEPSEEEKEAMKQFREDAREGGGGGTKPGDNPVAQELLEKAEALDGKLDFTTNPGRKHAVGEFVALVKGKVDLPENRNAKMEVGKLVMANCNGKSPKEIMQIIFDKFGFADVKQEKAAAKEAAAEAACANPKNAALILAFEECSKYYFAESNRNAALSYKKAIATLTELEEAVTEDNALSFSKGKTKLPGIGKATAEKMREFCQTGTFAKLEEKREAHK
ncbi:unnamed protein product [Pseudo-nitzschia multistriata]|uniref:PARP-type domain-containing protein n=1 Tax=Pseudo-nitzschia multistriata TaxID=183589 RepID=A0A448ZLW5_9STRA|nr:unnamed protein product [Pseudo-nitzschia multistriata]